jgi:hypothetical protein
MAAAGTADTGGPFRNDAAKRRCRKVQRKALLAGSAADGVETQIAAAEIEAIAGVDAGIAADAE